MTARTKVGILHHDMTLRREARNGGAKKMVGVYIAGKVEFHSSPYLPRLFLEKEIYFYILKHCYFSFGTLAAEITQHLGPGNRIL